MTRKGCLSKTTRQAAQQTVSLRVVQMRGRVDRNVYMLLTGLVTLVEVRYWFPSPMCGVACGVRYAKLAVAAAVLLCSSNWFHCIRGCIA